jgi:putative serine protease PepD
MDDYTTPQPPDPTVPPTTVTPTSVPPAFTTPTIPAPFDPTPAAYAWPEPPVMTPAPPTAGWTPAASAADRPRARRTIGLVLAGSLAAATLASAGTAAFVLGTRPAAAPVVAPTAPPSSSGTSGTLAGLDASSTIVAVHKAASPAVVTITSTSSGTGRGAFGGAAEGIGSGFIYDASGWILTNYHVVEGSGTLTVTLNDGRELTARVASTDEEHDLAVIKIDGSGFPTIPVGSSANLQVGQLVIAIGSPLGTFTDSVTSGILSATGRSVTVLDQATRQRRTITGLLQTDAAINEGNSGGPLLDARGQVVGLNSAVASNAQGIGFAIPIDAAASIMASALTH